jgi:two-component system NtrC family sensor kinase
MNLKKKGLRPSSLSVRQKISLGYGITFGIAIAGTIVGFALGERLEHAAIASEKRAVSQAELISRLRTEILETRLHEQSLLPLMDDPAALRAESAEAAAHSRRVRNAWEDLAIFTNRSATLESSAGIHALPPSQGDLSTQADSAHGDGVSAMLVTDLLQRFEADLETYLQVVERLDSQLQGVRVLDTVALQQIEATLRNLLASDAAQGLDALSHELGDFVEAAYVDVLRAENDLRWAIALKRWIVLGSIALSVGLAVVVVRTLSKALSDPLLQVTTMAQQVTEDGNFELQVPVTTTDEIGVLATSFNQLIQRVKVLLDEQKVAAQEKLIQSEKMSSLGQMLAGVAHEINNPVNFIHGNLIHAEDYIADVFSLIQAYEAAIPTPPATVQDVAEEIDWAFLRGDLLQMVKSMKLGSERTRQIVMSLKNFSRLDNTSVHPVDLHECLDSTLLLIHNRVKKGIDVVRQYGQIPPVEGYTGALYQVFMNLLSNAIDALEEAATAQPVITITTEKISENRVAVRIKDNGLGISEENQHKIFETFFTTKPAGVGTGLGLAITREVVVEKHHGQIRCHSTMGEGAEFVVELPIQQPFEIGGSALKPEMNETRAIALAK